MGLIKKVTTMLTLLIHVIMLSFGDYNAKEVLEKVKSAYQSIQDASANFDQVVEYKIAKLNQKYEGKIQIKKQDKMRIETDEQVLVTDGETSWTYSVLNEKVIIDKYDPKNSELSASRFFVEFPNDFYMEVVGTENIAGKKMYVLKLTPKNSDNYIQSMKLWADEKEWFVRQISVSDINGSNTTYLLKDLQINKGLPDQNFKFVPGKNVEVIDLR